MLKGINSFHHLEFCGTLFDAQESKRDAAKHFDATYCSMISLWSHPREKYVDLDELFSEHHNNTNSNGGENGDYLFFYNEFRGVS